MHEYFYGMYDSDDSEEFLEHHGILGMKWGIRRFQNEDGTLKAAGKKRRAEERVRKRAERKAAKAEKKAAEAEEAKKKLRAEIDDAIANVDFEKLSKLKGQMTDEDLKRMADRAGNLGRASTQLENYKKNLPPSAFDKAVKALGAVKTGLDAIKGAHESYNNLKKEFGIDRKSLMESLKDDDDSGSKSDDGPDIFDRIKDLTTNIAKDAASKASDKAEAVKEKREADKLQKQLKEASDRIKDNDTLDWLKSVSGSNKEPTDAEKQRDLQISVSGKGKIDRGFKLGDGDYSLFRNTSNTPISKVKSSSDSKPIKKTLKDNGSKPISEVFKEVDDFTDELLRKGAR